MTRMWGMRRPWRRAVQGLAWSEAKSRKGRDCRRKRRTSLQRQVGHRLERPRKSTSRRGRFFGVVYFPIVGMRL